MIGDGKEKIGTHCTFATTQTVVRLASAADSARSF